MAYLELIGSEYTPSKKEEGKGRKRKCSKEAAGGEREEGKVTKQQEISESSQQFEAMQ
jgi:hypothetical protein